MLCNGAKATIYINGQQVPDVTEYSINQTAGGLPTFDLSVLASKLTFDGDGFIPELPEIFKPFYTRKS